MSPTPIALRDPLAFEGRVELHTIASQLLDGGRFNDPTTRQLAVYVPPNASGPLPVVMLLPGFTGNWTSFVEAHPWKEAAVKQYERGVQRGEFAPALLVMPDCWTRLGGSQFVDSSCLGAYESYLIQEVVPHVRASYDVRGERFAVCGKSSGGFGAMRLSMRFPRVFGAAASISGDVNFELGYAAEFPAALRGLVDHDMDPARFIAAFLDKPELKGDDHAVLNTLAMAACYSPADNALGFDLPFDLRTCARIDAVWQRWLAFDPLAMIADPELQTNWKTLDCLHLECGLKDQFHLQWGLRLLANRLTDLGIAHDHVEHAGSHFDINHRYPPAIDKLARAL